MQWQWLASKKLPSSAPAFSVRRLPPFLIGDMTQLLAHDSIATWLEHRMSQQPPLRQDSVRLMGVLVVDPLFADSDTAARTTWIGDAASMPAALHEWKDQFHRFDAVAAVAWSADGPEVTIVIVNP